MNKKILLIGGGGHCKSILDSLIKANEYDEIGIIDKKENIGKKILGISIIACDENLPELINLGFQYAFVTIGSVGDPSRKIELYDYINNLGFIIPNIIDSSAILTNNVNFGKGVFIGKGSIVNAGTIVKKGAIINSGAIIEHDCTIGEFAHVSPGAVLGGEVQIGNNTHIGLNSTVKQQVYIGSNTVIGMGSVVTKNIGDDYVAYGNPCKEVKKK